MKNRILVIAVLLLTFALLSIPVMAEPAIKIEGVTVTASVTQTMDPGYPRFVSHGTISHGKGTSVGTVTVNIPGKTPLNGIWNGEFVSNGHWKEDPDVLNIRGKLVWTFTGGTFEGVVQRKITGLPISGSSYFKDNAVLRGTGDFQGQTLKLTFEGYPPVIQAGYIIIPK